MRIFFIVCATMIFCQAMQKCIAEQLKDEKRADFFQKGRASIAFSVGNRAVTWQDVKDRYDFILKTSHMEETEATKKVLLPQVVNQLCTEYVQMALCERVGLKPSKEDTNKAFEDFAKVNNTTVDTLKKQLVTMGINISTLEKRLTAQALWGDYVRGAESSVIKITPSKIEQKRKEILNDQKQVQFELSEIIVATQSLAHTVYEKAKKGDVPFSVLAQEMSSALSAKQGGKIGWVTLKQLDPAIHSAVEKSLQSSSTAYNFVGYVSHPIKTNRGFVVYKITDVKFPGKAAYSQSKVTMLKRFISIPQFTSEESVHAFEDNIKGFLNVRGEKAFQQYESSYAGSTEVQVAELSQLPELLRHKIETMKMQVCSEPIRLSEDQMMVFMVTKRTSEHEDKPVTDQEIMQMLRQQLLEQFAITHMRNYRKMIPIADATGFIQGATPLK